MIAHTPEYLRREAEKRIANQISEWKTTSTVGIQEAIIFQMMFPEEIPKLARVAGVIGDQGFIISMEEIYNEKNVHPFKRQGFIQAVEHYSIYWDVEMMPSASSKQKNVVFFFKEKTDEPGSNSEDL